MRHLQVVMRDWRDADIDTVTSRDRKFSVRPDLVQLVAFAIVAAAGAVPILAAWPGWMNADSLAQLYLIQHNAISDQHATMLNWLLVVPWKLGMRSEQILILQGAGICIGMWLIVRAAFRPIGASIVVAALVLSPMVVGNYVLLGRDTWMCGFVLLAYGSLVRAAQRHGKVRGAFLAASVLFAVGALASRQNAIFIMVPFAIGWAVIWLRGRGVTAAGWRRKIVLTTGSLASLLLAAVAILVVSDAVTKTRTAPETQLYIYDLIAESIKKDKNLLPPSVVSPDRWEQVRANYGIEDIVPSLLVESVDGSKDGLYLQARKHPEDVADAYKDAVLNDPISYLEHRLETFAGQIQLTVPAKWTFHGGIDQPNALGLKLHDQAASDSLGEYIDLFSERPPRYGGLLFTTWVYLLVGGIASVSLLVLGNTRLRLVGSLGIAAMLYQVGLLFLAMGLVYRFEFPVVAICVLVTAVALRAWWGSHRSRRAPVPAEQAA